MAGSPTYTIISADCHAGGSHVMYREYLESRYHDDFDAWRGAYRNPYRDLQDDTRMRNWDDDRRNAELEADGVVAEVIFPNTIPPFFPSFVLFAQPPTAADYELRLAGIRAHNRWLADWCAAYPERRAGIGQIFLNDIDDAIADIRWIREHGLRGGVLIPNVPPDVDWIEPLYSRAYDRVWAECQDLGVVVNTHGGTGAPRYGDHPVAPLIRGVESSFHAQRPLTYFLVSGVFERFPDLRFVLTEAGAAWVPPLLKRLDSYLSRIRDTGRVGENRFSDDVVLPRLASEYFARNCWIGASQPRPEDVVARHEIGIDRFMWGSDYPHMEGTYPFTREHLRQVFSHVPEGELRKILGESAAEVYGFDLSLLAERAARFGPRVDEVARPLDELPDGANQALLLAAGVG